MSISDHRTNVGRGRLRNIILTGLLLAWSSAGAGAAFAKPVLRTIPDSTPLGSGSFKVIPSMEPGLPDHTVYASLRMSVLGKRRLPLVVWAEGGCINNGTRFRWFLSEIASHGYLVVATGRMGTLEDQIWHPPASPGVAPDPANIPPAATHSSQLIDAINWAIAENTRPGSRYFDRIDTSKVAVMGMSCGGIQAIEAGADPRVTTTVVWNSGLFPDGSGRNVMAGGRPLTKADLARLHGSVAYISGDKSDVAFENANDDFERLHGIPVLRAYRKDTPHEGTYGEENGGDFGRVAVAWLNWRLQGNQDAARLLSGADCGLCRDPQWVVSHAPE
jgi:dienelactone hydrolase